MTQVPSDDVAAADAIPGIPVFRPGFDQEELDALAEVFASGWLGPGPKVEAFEKAFAQSVGARHTVSVSSCTAALHLACLGLGLGPGDRVLAPSLSFASSAHAAVYCGAEVVFADVDEQTCTLDPDDLERKVGPGCKGVIAVHYGGHPCRMDRIWDWAEKKGLWVIEDAAHACGASYQGVAVGGSSRSAAVCFSFNTLKNLSTGDGGMLATPLEDVAVQARALRWMGIDRSTYERVSPEEGRLQHKRYRTAYSIDRIGYKYAMNDINAALGLVQLSKLPAFQARRREMASRYQEAFRDLDWLQTPVEREDVVSAWHLFAVQTPFQQPLRHFLGRRSIASSIHYAPLHLEPVYRTDRTPSLPVTERLAGRLLTLPFHPRLSDAEAGRVLDALREFSPQRARRESEVV